MSSRFVMFQYFIIIKIKMLKNKIPIFFMTASTSKSYTLKMKHENIKQKPVKHHSETD